MVEAEHTRQTAGGAAENAKTQQHSFGDAPLVQAGGVFIVTEKQEGEEAEGEEEIEHGSGSGFRAAAVMLRNITRRIGFGLVSATCMETSFNPRRAVHSSLRAPCQSVGRQDSRRECGTAKRPLWSLPARLPFTLFGQTARQVAAPLRSSR